MWRYNISLLILFISITTLYSYTSITIKVYHVFENFGTETHELKNSIVMKYDNQGLLVDSTIYSHNVPLHKKYVYVSGINEGLKLKRTYDQEMVLSYLFEYDKGGNRIETSLYGAGDSLYWKEYQKYDLGGNIIKQIRYNPFKAVNPKMMTEKNNVGEMIWGETYDYDSTGTILQCKEFYNNYVLVITTYKLDSLKMPKKKSEYFDPSVISQTIFFHDSLGQLLQERTTGRLGGSLQSKSYEYDVLGRKTLTTIYSSKGKIDKIYNTIFDDDNFKTFDYYSDSLIKLSAIKETILDNQGRKYIETTLDGEDKVLEKNIYYYNKTGNIEKIKKYDMVRRRKNREKEIPIRVHIYEYD